MSNARVNMGIIQWRCVPYRQQKEQKAQFLYSKAVILAANLYQVLATDQGVPFHMYSGPSCKGHTSPHPSYV